jgi:hypothetical protein
MRDGIAWTVSWFGPIITWYTVPVHVPTQLEPWCLGASSFDEFHPWSTSAKYSFTHSFLFHLRTCQDLLGQSRYLTRNGMFMLCER